MKVAIVCESPADEAAVLRLICGILGTAVDAIPVVIAHSSWPRVCRALVDVIPAAYYQWDADGLVVVVDSDDSPIHELTHDPHSPDNSKCRICNLNGVIARVMQRLKPRPTQRPLQVALGLAVPAIEAWLLTGIRHEISEATFINSHRQKSAIYTRANLKQWLYRTMRPTLEVETTVMIREAERILHGQLRQLELLFPLGFGLFATQLRGWVIPPEA